jgi:hypothetical protein
LEMCRCVYLSLFLALIVGTMERLLKQFEGRKALERSRLTYGMNRAKDALMMLIACALTQR